MGTHKLYKGKYFLVFYDRFDEELLHIFDNVREICKHLEIEATRHNVNLLNRSLCYALKSQTHFFKLGQTLTRVYMISTEDD